MPLSLVLMMVLRERSGRARRTTPPRWSQSCVKIVAGDLAGYLLEPDAVAAAADDFAVDDADVAPAEAMDETAALGQGLAAAVEA